MKVLDRIVPVVACSYFIIAMFIILKNITYMPTVFGGIFSQAFGLKPLWAADLGQWS